MKKVVLAYSGGLDTSVAVAWLREKYDVEVVTLTVDLGGGSLREGRGAARPQRRRVAAYVVDARDRFVSRLRVAASPGRHAVPGRVPAGHGAGRPLIAKLLVDVATGEGRRRRPRLHRQGQRPGPLRRGDPGAGPGAGSHRAGARGMGMTRDEEIEYAKAHGIEVPVTDAARRIRSTRTCGAARSRRASSKIPGTSRPTTSTRGPSIPAMRRTSRARSRSLRARHPVSLDGEALDAGDARRAAQRRSPASTAWAASTTSRTASSASSPARSTRRRPPSSSTSAHRAPRGPDALARTRCASTASSPTSWPQLIYDGLWFSALHRDLRGYVAVVAARRVGRRPDAARPRQRGGRRPPQSALAVRQEPRHVRQGRRVRPQGAPWASSRSSGCRCGPRPRATARVGKRHGAAWTWTDPLLEGLPTHGHRSAPPPTRPS